MKSPVTSMSEIPTESSSVKLGYVTNTAGVTEAQAELSASVPSQSLIKTFNPAGKFLFDASKCLNSIILKSWSPQKLYTT